MSPPEVEALAVSLALDQLAGLVELELERGLGGLLGTSLAGDQRLVELALVEQRQAEVQEVLRLRDARDRLAELSARGGELLLDDALIEGIRKRASDLVARSTF